MKTCFSEEKLIKQFENPPFSENPRPKKCLLILDLKPFIIGQRKTFYRQRIPVSRCPRK